MHSNVVYFGIYSREGARLILHVKPRQERFENPGFQCLGYMTSSDIALPEEIDSSLQMKNTARKTVFSAVDSAFLIMRLSGSDLRQF